jgi:hypothetical protein
VDKKVEALRAHPAADAYRLMDADELAELVESIAANGLRDPITIGRIGRERWIVDGRNRFKACEIAGAPPAYEEIEFADEDALLAFVADRNERRNITAGQKAMGYARLFPDAKLTNGRRANLSGKPERLSQGHWQNLVSQARAILRYTPELAAKVRDGFPLSEAYEAAMTVKRAPDSDEFLRAKLSAAPEFMTLVEEGKMSLREACAALDERKSEEEKHKKIATGNLIRILTALYPQEASPEHYEAMMFGAIDRKYWPAGDHEIPLTSQTVQDCIDVLSFLLKRVEGMA